MRNCNREAAKARNGGSGEAFNTGESVQAIPEEWR